MPSPFPGMDPYVEAPAIWPDFHTSLVAVCREVLVPQLRPKYVVGIERRVYVLGEDDPAQRTIVPDVTVVAGDRGGRRGRAAGAVAVVREPTVILMAVDEAEVREPCVVIRAAGDRAVVTVIEVLSPANKMAGSHGREEYLAKRREILRSSVHLVEIDLLRLGVPIPSVDPLPPGDYHAHVSRAAMRPRGEVWSWTMHDPLPTLPVPLRKGDPDASFDLARAFREVYDRGGYDGLADYRALPPPPLAEGDAAWAASLLPRAGRTG